jgi:predicted RND superfamily exporter protein
MDPRIVSDDRFFLTFGTSGPQHFFLPLSCSLECVCLAILIGMSCDFVLHVGHAYMTQPPALSRQERTQNALVQMGPSILAAGFTTIAGSVVMLYSEIVFFRRFALILLYSISIGLVGALSVFIVILDLFGPSNKCL